MYCPKCAAQNLDDAKFCRACGTDISRVPQALAGEPPARTLGFAPQAPMIQPDAFGPRSHRRGERPTIEQGVVNLFMGVAFAIIALVLSQPGGTGDTWWFYMLIPAFIFFGKGVGTLARIRHERLNPARPASAPDTARLAEPQRVSALPPRDTDELIAPPPSVTEATTRHLGVPVERKPKDV